VVLNSQGGVVAICPSEADARAFVALPALMRALRDLIDAIPEPTLVDDPVLRGWVGHAEAALAQADGPAPTEENR
jgi:hypothetical protein